MTKKKAEKMIAQTRKKPYKLRPDTIRYIIELVNEHPMWGVERIFEEALKPRIRTILQLPLTPKMNKALTKAAARYQTSIADVACEAVEEWLKARKLY